MFANLTPNKKLDGSWYCIGMVLGVFAIFSCGFSQQQDVPLTEPPLREFRAAWIATVENIDWPSKPGLPVDKQKSELLGILDKAKKIRLNAVVLQVRPCCDALYRSDLEPWSSYLTGTQGLAPNPLWDPLEFAVAEAHRRGLELHAWINPFRAMLSSSAGPLAASHVSVKHPEWVKQYGKFLWLDPGESGARQHSLNVILDIVRRYDLDGVHIDDYFYPYHQKDPKTKKDLPFPDEPSWGAYLKRGGTMKQDEWRRRNVNLFVQAMYEQVKKLKPWIKVGISPFGIYRPGYPSTVKAGFDQYTAIYADPLYWLAQGWCDYMAPQLYWKINSPQSFTELLKWWSEHNPHNRFIWPGVYTGRIFPGNQDWPAQEIVDQINQTREMMTTPGQIHFSFKSFSQNPKSINEALTTQAYTRIALVPEIPGSLPGQIAKPSEVRRQDDTVTWKAPKSLRARFWAIYVKAGGNWKLTQVVSKDEFSCKIDPFVEAVAVSAINVFGHESEKVQAP